jgi:hypothetical protein
MDRMTEQKEQQREYQITTITEESLRNIWKTLFHIEYPTKPIKAYILKPKEFALVRTICGVSDNANGWMQETKDCYVIVLLKGYRKETLYHELIHVYDHEPLKEVK